MRLYLKKSHPRKRGLWGWIKNWFGEILWHLGRSTYCHVELQFSGRHDWLSYSSVPPQGPRLADRAYHPDEWDCYEIALSAKHEEAIWQQAQTRLGPQCNYDGQGLGSFVLPKLIKPSATDMWCSETVVDAGHAGDLFLDLYPEKASPDDCCESAIAGEWWRVW